MKRLLEEKLAFGRIWPPEPPGSASDTKERAFYSTPSYSWLNLEPLVAFATLEQYDLLVMYSSAFGVDYSTEHRGSLVFVKGIRNLSCNKWLMIIILINN